ncbi:hypothetical protein PRIPAC_86708 [Pristionchus pacificus]|uniref:Endo/exonuclease/phosphatase domain-containing protein n=1 Tax=Pristionchus pacificus TaxID=54126 RepID=A0A2A6BTB5_PRIPA|nr:hypothetical protein PRIPAC_86708 [Pristionchus pacificus]|eukprot:PDM69107.1 hypothetical protein PRIPAC_47409 [Pristionchus pacificus]
MPSTKLQGLMISRRHLLASFRLGRVWMRPSLTKEERVCSVDRPFTYDSPGMSRSSAAKRTSTVRGRSGVMSGSSGARPPASRVTNYRFLPVGVLWSASLIHAQLSFLNTRGVSKCAEPPKLTVIYANIRSILNEVNHSCLKSQLEANEYFVYCFTESWLRKTDPDGAIIGSFSSNYCVMRCDRGKKRGGESKLDSHEILVVDLRVGTESARIILLYRVPALSQACSEHIWEKLDDYTKCAHPTVIVGDFNLPEIKWPKTTQHYSGASADFIKCCDEIGLNVEQLPNYGNSDHSAFSFQLLLAPEEQRAKYVKNFRKADYGKINTLLANIDWNAFFEIKMTVNEMYERFITLLDEIIEKYIPLMRIDSTGKPMPDHIHRLSKRRHLAWSQFLMDDKKSSKIKFEKLHAEYNREFRTPKSANSGGFSDMETSTMKTLTFQISLKTVHTLQKYLHSNSDGSVGLSKGRYEDALWTPLKHVDGTWSFQSTYGGLLSSDKNSSVYVVTEQIDAWENFSLERVDE